MPKKIKLLREQELMDCCVISTMLIHSLGEVLSCVKSGFELPDVIKRQKAVSYRALFIYLYQMADENSVISLDAEKIGRAIGFSRKTIYKAIAFLKRVNLLKIKVFQQGRGHHSLYELNWKRNRHPLSINKINIHSLRNDKVVERQKFEQQNLKKNQHGRMMRAFRELLSKTFMTLKEQKLCVSVIGRFLKNRSIESCRLVYHHLTHKLYLLEPPNWVLKIQDLCRWFWCVLKRASSTC